MDYITRCYIGMMRLVEGSDTLYPVRWYHTDPDADIWDGDHAFLSSHWDDANYPPRISGVGEIRQRCPELVSCRYDPPPADGTCTRGDPAWYITGVPPDVLATAEVLPWCGGDPMPRWAELIQRSTVDETYGWWELVCSPVNGRLERGPQATHRHLLEEDPVWERNGMRGIPVPATIVEIHEGCDGRPWAFTHDDLISHVLLQEAEPSVELPTTLAYEAFVVVPTLVGAPGVADITGAWTATTLSVVALDLRPSTSVTDPGPYHARRIGEHSDGRPVFSFRSAEPAGCAACTVTTESATSPPPLPDPPPGEVPDGVTHQLVDPTGAVTLVRWVTWSGWSGWWDVCTCTWVPWWCAAAECVQALAAPPGATGPYATPAECEAACGGGGFVIVDCCIPPIPELLTVTVSNQTGNACLPSSFTIVWNGALWVAANVPACGTQFSPRLGCNPGGATWSWSTVPNSGECTWTAIAFSWICSPFTLEFLGVTISTVDNGGACDGTADFVITG